ncbi:conserved hypothetical protein [Candidatus Sulfotelmatobacter sp. SbA7]|nr:conserved hypothetical protein [Candidatus Sulfotelmatobacter sp. SbA7]
MARLLQWLLPKTDEHLSDEQIIAAIDGDSPAAFSAHAARHLDSCWQCLARRQQLQDTIVRVVDYQRELVAPFLPPPPRGEDRFIARLDRQVQSAGQRRWPRFVLLVRSLGMPPMNPVLASTIVVLIAVSTLLLIWSRTRPSISASQFLERAKVWDESPGNGEPGVVYQRIRIRAPQQTIESTVYRDVQRHRRPRTNSPHEEEQQLERTLSLAGISWDEPLSAIAFKQWHDRQGIKRDEIARSGDDLVTLTTTVAEGTIADESLTVRKADFHPVAKSVHFREAGTIEIAELDYAVLGWNAVNDSLFEPLSSGPGATPPRLAIPSLPTREELDEAELQARLVLSRLNADSTEQLQFSRSAKAIVINGVVETKERKNSLLAQLRPLPHVMSSIFSLEELSARGASQPSSLASVQEYSDVARPSPLEELFRRHARTQTEVSSVSRQVLDAALAVQQESSAVTELWQRFGPDSDLNEPAQAALKELLETHSRKLSDGLDAEEQAVHAINLLESSPPGSLPALEADKPQTLTAAAARNRALCSELIAGAQSSPRPAHAITSNILTSIEELRRLARNSLSTTIR